MNTVFEKSQKLEKKGGRAIFFFGSKIVIFYF